MVTILAANENYYQLGGNVNKYIPIIAAPVISYSAYYARTNNYCNLPILNKVCEISETVGHFITKHLIIEGLLHHLEILATTTIINHVTTPYQDSHNILLTLPYCGYNVVSNILATTTSPINVFMEHTELNLGKGAVVLYGLSLIKNDIQLYAEKYTDFGPHLAHIYEWYHNAGKGTSIETYYNTADDLWAVIHPLHHFSDAHKQLDKNSNTQELIGTLLLSTTFYIYELEEIKEGIYNLANTVTPTYNHYFNPVQNIENILYHNSSMNICYPQEEYNS
ncbi:hypothetical protein NOVO_02480 [Rickettsiales bacterium Ac37b]|nr:hypothetical protein NOVO_02480 [Rickettsiales bacterium Ac37b]